MAAAAAKVAVMTSKEYNDGEDDVEQMMMMKSWSR
jgi:hypothetical protein